MATVLLKNPHTHVQVQRPVFPVVHATEQRGSVFPFVAVGRTHWFTLEDAHREAEHQSTLYPEPHRFAVYGSDDEYLGYWMAGKFKGPYQFVVEE